MVPLVASRSTCLRRKVGAIFVKKERIVSTGYNGSPPGLAHCSEMGGCLRKKLNVQSGQRAEICRAVHAEENAILFSRHREDLEGSTLYITCTPCMFCVKSLITVQVRRIVYHEGEYPDMLAMGMIKEAGIKLEKIPLDWSFYHWLWVGK